MMKNIVPIALDMDVKGYLDAQFFIRLRGP
jgi:hypothetical protein